MGKFIIPQMLFLVIGAVFLTLSLKYAQQLNLSPLSITTFKAAGIGLCAGAAIFEAAFIYTANRYT